MTPFSSSLDFHNFITKRLSVTSLEKREQTSSRKFGPNEVPPFENINLLDFTSQEGRGAERIQEKVTITSWGIGTNCQVVFLITGDPKKTLYTFSCHLLALMLASEDVQ